MHFSNMIFTTFVIKGFYGCIAIVMINGLIQNVVHSPFPEATSYYDADIDLGPHDYWITLKVTQFVVNSWEHLCHMSRRNGYRPVPCDGRASDSRGTEFL